MKQQVNLYLTEFRVEKDKLTPLLMGQILGGIVLTMIVVAALDVFTRWQLEGELTQVRQVLVAETTKTNDIDAQLASRSQNSDLVARLANDEAVLNDLERIAEFLSETKLGNVTGFSEYFKDISRAMIPGLAVSGFEFSEGGEGILISGKVADSALVPLYVNNVKQGSSPLRSSRFSPRISRDGQLYSFVLSNRYE
ncbi:MAG: hypothetical protein ACJA2D_000945 [Pseudohongiellaceae bacterium]|jgi:hypothetical protein